MFRIALLPGDGIGPEVVEEALRVLRAVSSRCGFEWTSERFRLGADHYLETGETLPASVYAHLRDDFDAILLGAFGDPRVPNNVVARDVLLGLRQRFDLYVNLRPVKLLDPRHTPLRDAAKIDYVVVRENTESIYVDIGGSFKKDTPDEVAQNVMIATRKGVDRILRFAFELARSRGGRLCLGDKSNAIKDAHGLWRRALSELCSDYPDVQVRTLYADVAAMRLVTHPHEFDVVVADNLVGDVLSDLGAALVGGLGLSPSSNVGPANVPYRPGIYEPVHGSAPDLAGKGLANPMAAILTAGLMLADAGQREAAERVERAVEACLLADEVTPDLGGSLSTAQVGEAVARRILS